MYENKSQKTGLLTGFDTLVPKRTIQGENVWKKEALGGVSRFSPGTIPTQDGAVFSPPGLGADASFTEILSQFVNEGLFSSDILAKDSDKWITVKPKAP